MKGMKAWLVTWDWTGDAAAVADRIAAILPPGWGEDRVANIVEVLYARATSTLAELASYAKDPASNPYRPMPVTINNVVHSERLTCGHHPWLYARKVSGLLVRCDPETGLESIEWTEPDTYRLKPDRSGTELVSKGGSNSCSRQVTGPLSDEGIWDRATGTWKAGFHDPDA